MDIKQNEAFTEHLRAAIREAERLKYIPTRFKSMVQVDGGFETVKRILASGRPSEGFQKLWELGRLDLTCEAIIVESSWRPYFDADLLERAERLLREMNYPFKRFETSPATLIADVSVSEVELDLLDEVETEVLDEAGATTAAAANRGINAFFKGVLHAPVSNVRWSWGAIDERRRRVFLRLWRSEIVPQSGVRLIRVLGPERKDRPGWSERLRHIELIRSGYAAFGVLCDRVPREGGGIANFDNEEIQQLGTIQESDGLLFMEMTGVVSINSLGQTDVSPEALISDLAEIRKTDIAETTRAALVNARLGQGKFRRDLMQRWDSACAVTGCRVAAVLRASHCKPWRDSDNHERLDSHNGLMLSANLDALFDAGLIAFDDEGGMLVAEAVSKEERQALAIPAHLTRKPSKELREYLRFHRERVFL